MKQAEAQIIERLLTTIEEQGAQILKLSELIANAERQVQHPVQHVPTSYQTDEWIEPNDEFEELRQQREATQAETVSALEEKLKDSNFLNTEIDFNH